MYFPSKKDVFHTITIWGVVLFIVFIYAFGGEPTGFQLISYRDPLGYVLGGLTIGVLVWIWFHTGYKVENQELLIHSGPLRKRINIMNITKIKTTKSLMSSPALSLEKLEIFYGDYKSTFISPQDEQRFVHALLEKNPQIEIIRH
ncbi:PH domain-containing protein [Halobacillus faecis]|uniref:Uncharacterized protein YyaB-like PH domain-containing protein n=1 Tax=Halobacillus faecis TaxID=360184 RepID=A0A511WQM5_9BACI|nr:PH domain-containing protein [Halobacillus faecis]GEN52731.1 hypothetical protein HFA01_09930 [Halobacillus faecis]